MNNLKIKIANCSSNITLFFLRMISLIRSLTLIMLFGTSFLVMAQAADIIRPVPEQLDVPPRFRDIIAWREVYKVPVAAMAVFNQQEIEWMQVLGDLEPGKPAPANTVFNVASLTKPVFGMIALQLIAKNELDVDASVSEHWIDPDIHRDFRYQALTPRVLLSHQAGFPNWRGKKPLAFMFEPGSRHEYSGEGYEYLRRQSKKHRSNHATVRADTCFEQSSYG